MYSFYILYEANLPVSSTEFIELLHYLVWSLQEP